MAEEASERRVRKPAGARSTEARGGRTTRTSSKRPAKTSVPSPDGQDDDSGFSAPVESDAPVPPASRRKRRAPRDDDDMGLHTMDGHKAQRPPRIANPLVDIDDLESSGESMADLADAIPDDVEDAEDSAEEPPKIQRRVLDPTQLYRGRARMALMRDLAMGEWSHDAIAKSVGVHPEFIRDFAETYAEDIAEVRSALQGQVAVESGGLWISKRVNRIAELQGDYEDIDLVVEEMRKNWRAQNEDDKNMVIGSRRHQALLRAKLSILKAVSDELAPSKAKQDEDMDKNTVRYVIEQDDGNDIIEALT